MDLLLSSEETPLVQKYMDILTDGGVFMWLIIATSILLAAIVIYKFLTLNNTNVFPGKLRRLISDFAENPSEQKAEELQKTLESSDSTLGDLCKAALSKQEEGQDEVEKLVEIKARESIVKISSGLSVIDVIITIAPLLGLLGTASGLVGVFSSLDGDVTDHTALAKGISEALYTTIAGLAVAVPGVIAQSHFTRKVETMASELELLMSKFIGVISK